MKRDAAEILKEALALPTDGRAALAGSLLESLDIDVDEDADVAWATEVNRRVVDLDIGTVKSMPWGRGPPPTRRALIPVHGRIPSHSREPMQDRARTRASSQLESSDN